MRPFRRELQIIFQDPFSSLNPRMNPRAISSASRCARIILRAAKHARRGSRNCFDRVGLSRAQMGNYPHQFSGGQRQRIGIAAH